MANISLLRQFVNNGWTIANRRAICSQIGKSNFEEIIQMAKNNGITGDIFEYQMAKSNLTNGNIQQAKLLLNNKLKDQSAITIFPNKIKIYSSLDEILEETNNIPLMNECRPTDLYKIICDSSQFLRNIQVYGKNIFRKKQIYAISKYKDEIELLKGKELEDFLLKYPTAKEYAEDYLKITAEKSKRILSEVPETTKEYFLWRGITLHENPHFEEKQFNEIMKNAKIGDIICPDYSGAWTSGYPDYTLLPLSKSKYDRPDVRGVLMKIIVLL